MTSSILVMIGPTSPTYTVPWPFAKRLPKVRGSQKALHPANKALQQDLCPAAQTQHCKSFNHVCAGKPKGKTSLQTALDLKQRRDSRVPSAPSLCLSTCRAQPTTINCLHGHQPDGEPKKVSWGWGQMLVHHQVQAQQQIALCHEIWNDLEHLAELH